MTKGATIEDIIEVNDMYVESIKAKLELLNDFKWIFFQYLISIFLINIKLIYQDC